MSKDEAKLPPKATQPARNSLKLSTFETTPIGMSEKVEKALRQGWKKQTKPNQP